MGWDISGEASGWGTYYVVFLSALLSLVFSVVLAGFSYLLFGRRRSKVKSEIKTEPIIQFPSRMNTRFFLGVNSAIMLISLCLLLIPCVVTITDSVSMVWNVWIRGFIVVLTTSGFLALALFYSARKGDLNWQKTVWKKTEE